MAREPMVALSAANQDQIEFWDGPGGTLWTRKQAVQDQLLAPVSNLLHAAARPTAGLHVLDIGCGCGGTALAMAAAVGPTGSVLGIDVSREMLALARSRVPPSTPLTFLQADAMVHAFEPHAFDLLISRFGVMFFADPVAAFTNLRAAAKPDARLVFACWQAPRQNPWMMVPLQAAYRHVPKLPATEPHAPGPFAFADGDRTRGILTVAGFTTVEVSPHTLTFDLMVDGDMESTVDAALAFGPISRAVQDIDATTLAAVKADLRSVLSSHQVGGRVPLDGAIWIVTATA